MGWRSILQVLIGWFGIDMWFLANSGRKGVGTFNDCKPEKRLVFQWIKDFGDYILERWA